MKFYCDGRGTPFPKVSYYSIRTKLLCCLLVLLSLNSNTFAVANSSVTALSNSFDDIKVHGVVTDSKGTTLPGVSIKIKGTNKGTITDMNGAYSITAPASGVLVFTFIGFASQELAVKAENTVNVKLLEASNSLDAVVVVGYGTQSKRLVTGAISKVDLAQTRSLPNTNVTEALRGRVAGVQFTSNGRPGQNGSILIRGPRSLSGGNDPLIVVDGIFFNGNLSDINPNDIESIDVLKDASAAAIYGSRAANGVILVTSKKGTSDKPVVTLNSYYGVSEIARTIKLLSPERYIEKTLDYLKESGQAVKPDIADNLTSVEAENYRAGKSLDPWQEATQDASISSVDLSVAGKSGKTSFYNSASYTNEKGLMYNDNQKRITLRSNIENQVNDWLKIGMTATFVNRDLSGISADLNSLYYSSPYGNWFYPDGQPTQFSVTTETISGNPLRSSILTTNSEVSQNLFSNFYGIVNIPAIKGLSYRVNFSPNYRWDHNYNAVRQDIHVTNNTKSASKFNQQSYDYVLENIVTYNRRINDDHYFDVTLLYGRNRNRFENTTATASQLSTDALGYNSLTFGGIQTVASAAQDVNGISSMARINYNYKEKYLVTLTARRDGSSVFAKNNKYATFPSAAIGWIASEEGFLKDSKTISLLKFKLSYGAVGNQAISPYQSISLSNTNNYVYGNPGITALGVYPANMANDNLKWETTYTSNLAVDFGLFNNRINGTVEVYNSDTKNLLVRRIIPVMTGYTSVQANLGATNNKGIDIAINTVNVKSSKFEWLSNFTVSMNKNKIVHLYRSDVNGDGKEDDDLANNWFIGHPITSYFDYVFNGIYQQGDAIPANSQPGFVRLKDLNGDGVINASDRTIVGSGGQPKFRGGIGNTFNYSGFSLYVFVNAMLGWTSDFILLDPNSTRSENSPGRALNQIDAGWWTPENKSATRPSLVYTNTAGHNYYVSRNFARIQDVSLSYNFPKKITDRLKLGSLRAYVSGKNLYTFTNYPGSDPEIITATGTAANIKANMYPLARTISFGFNVGF
ncbi:TonB-dependent receptor [Mucilaginibacter sabulilitoris]|uniref:TonB-dependent receptor n=1 Tax=Mucilaginibacter sabulilitoris TaxID=1173583 RepID=A0ABZ0TW25_9SPHI|nr:TonB-dependent receptor [Mucilaginibacter sabulilitoris]WPU96243.1 TonB-dependent receptor [Mucilaginibacter sabulilitoris]